MAEKVFNKDKICEELEQWPDLVTKRQVDVIQKARSYVRSEEQVRSVYWVSSKAWKKYKSARRIRKIMLKPK